MSTGLKTIKEKVAELEHTLGRLTEMPYMKFKNTMNVQILIRTVETAREKEFLRGHRKNIKICIQ